MWTRHLTILILTLVCFNLCLIGVGQPQTDGAVVFPVLHVYPESVTAGVGENFTISAMVFNLTDNIWEHPDHPEWGTFSLGNLYAFDIQFSWDPGVLEYVSHTVTVPVEVYPEGVLHEPVFEIEEEEVDETAGTYDLAYSSMWPAVAFNNPGASNSIFNMTFRVTSEGASALEFVSSDLADNSLPARPLMYDVEDGIFSSVSPGERDVKVASVKVSPERATQGVEVTVNATISNLGFVSEDFTATVYYNQTSIDWNDLMATGNWTKISERDETELEPAENRLLSFQWNTSEVLDNLGRTEAYFYVMVNVSQVPEEVNATNNFNWMRMWMSSEVIHDVAITEIDILPFGSPLIVNETATIQVTVLNNGTVPETFDVNLYYVSPGDGETSLSTWDIQDLLGSRQLSSTWDTTGHPLGLYTLVANASIVEDEETVDNNVMEQNVRVVGVPILEVTLSPADFERFNEQNGWYEWTGHLDEAITMNAEGSSHQDPNGSITEYSWKISFEGEVMHTETTSVVGFTFNVTGGWFVELKITDNYGLTYGVNRVQLKHYRHLIALTVEEEAEGLEGGVDIMVYAAVIIVVVIALAIAVYFLKFRKS